jgi:hypothetical protein
LDRPRTQTPATEQSLVGTKQRVNRSFVRRFGRDLLQSDLKVLYVALRPCTLKSRLS